MQTEANMDSYVLEASGTVQTSLRSTVDEISVVETDSQTPKTDPGTVADPQQTTSEPLAESMGVADKLNLKVDDALIESFQNVCIDGPVKIKVSCMN
ncbi:hypothetical protein Y1Q_0010528 [Alligator mississippiensis]|uniref:Uncharacterized protein n=1 Tax=Alligator mississippiensis TaxID=8496 RepID=A0A151ND97_ALLMI|nr:hypothetical protein Y1Q_0010528 [Alligator mississippiensis]